MVTPLLIHSMGDLPWPSGHHSWRTSPVGQRQKIAGTQVVSILPHAPTTMLSGREYRRLPNGTLSDLRFLPARTLSRSQLQWMVRKDCTEALAAQLFFL